jgi:hypothetical protein
MDKATCTRTNCWCDGGPLANNECHVCGTPDCTLERHCMVCYAREATPGEDHCGKCAEAYRQEANGCGNACINGRIQGENPEQEYCYCSKGQAAKSADQA